MERGDPLLSDVSRGLDTSNRVPPGVSYPAPTMVQNNVLVVDNSVNTQDMTNIHNQAQTYVDASVQLVRQEATHFVDASRRG